MAFVFPVNKFTYSALTYNSFRAETLYNHFVTALRAALSVRSWRYAYVCIRGDGDCPIYYSMTHLNELVTYI